jgi:hypothetical protein
MLFPEEVQDAILARVILLEREGPQLGRPHADTLKGSRHTNMKELRCTARDGVWRIAYAFDPSRRGFSWPGRQIGRKREEVLAAAHREGG